MEIILKELQSKGVHYIKNSDTIMLEILNNARNTLLEIDGLIQELIVCSSLNKIKKIRLECPLNILNQLKETKSKMYITGESTIYEEFSWR